MNTAAIIYDHRKRASSTKPGMVEIRITVNRKSYYISTGVKVLPSEWRLGAIINHFNARELNRRVAIVAQKVQNELNLCDEQSIPVNVSEIKRRVFAVKSTTDRPFLEWIEKQIPMLNFTPGSVQHYTTLLDRLTEFGKILRWQDLTVENIYMWDAWLHQLPAKLTRAQQQQGLPPSKISDATVWNYHKWLKAMISRAERFGLIDKNPYSAMRGQFSRGEHESVEYLSEDQMKAIEQLDVVPGSNKELARDLFVFQMYTGLAYADAQAFDINDYHLIDGHYINTGTRIKTGEPYVSVLLPQAVEVLKKYSWKVPSINNSDYNKYLKTIGRDAKIPIRMHSHLARHTFATFMLRHGAKIENVAKMLGHTNIKQTQRYAKVLPASVIEDFLKISES